MKERHLQNGLVRCVAFLDVVNDVSGGNTKVQSSAFLKAGDLPVVDQGRALIAGYTDDKENTFSSAELPVVVFGDHTKAVKYVDHPFAMGADGVKVLKPSVECDTKYLYHFLSQARIPDAGYSRHFKFVKRLEIPLPPLPEQRRIAAILDKADALRRKRREAIAKLDQLLQSVFLEMFGDPVTNPKGWPRQKTGDVFAEFVGGKNVQCPSADEGSPFRILKVSAVTSETFEGNESKPAPRDYLPTKTAIVRPGDLLFSRANTVELVAATAFVWRCRENLVLPDKIWRLVPAPDADVEPLFLWEIFKNESFRRELCKRATDTSGSMKNISKAKLREAFLCLPPRSLQKRFAKISKRFFRLVDSQSASGEGLDTMFTALQQRAFTGQL